MSQRSNSLASIDSSDVSGSSDTVFSYGNSIVLTELPEVTLATVDK